jgi:hypothetical protein
VRTCDATLCNCVLLLAVVNLRGMRIIHNRHCWRRHDATSSTENETDLTPVFALFNMQLSMVILHEQCLQGVSIELSKVCKQLLEVATAHMTTTDVTVLKTVLRLLLSKVYNLL